MKTAFVKESPLRACLLGFALLVLFIMVKGGLNHARQPGQFATLEHIESSVDEGNLTRRIAFVSLALIGAYGIFVHGKSRLGVQDSLGLLAALLVGWCLCSVGWSVETSLTARRLFVFGACCCGALAIAKHFSVWEIVVALCVCSGLRLGIDLLAAIALGTFAPWDPAYRFAGTMHPNYEAIVCAVLLLSSVTLARRMTAGSWLMWGLAAAALVLLFLTKSRSSLLAGLGALAMVQLLTAPRGLRVAIVLAAGVLIPPLLMIYGDPEELPGQAVTMLTREGSDLMTLSGRIPLWEELLTYVQARPMTGYGYNSFWTSLRVYELYESQGWPIAHAHSDYLEVTLGLGYVGLGLFAGMLFLGIIRALAAHRAYPEHGYDAFCAVLLYGAIVGLAEVVLWQPCLAQLAVMCVLAHLALTRPALAGRRAKCDALHSRACLATSSIPQR